jgi:hypothetical protein
MSERIERRRDLLCQIVLGRRQSARAVGLLDVKDPLHRMAAQENYRYEHLLLRFDDCVRSSLRKTDFVPPPVAGRFTIFLPGYYHAEQLREVERRLVALYIEHKGHNFRICGEVAFRNADNDNVRQVLQALEEDLMAQRIERIRAFRPRLC